jgi:hypothetical protein
VSTEPKPSNPKDIIGSDKLPLSLVPDTTIAYLTLGHLEGMLKYGLVNWRECGVRTSIYLDALARHVAKFKSGEWADPETRVPHLANALACLSIIVDAHECGKLIDDRPKPAPVAPLIDRSGGIVKHLKALFADRNPHHYTIGDAFLTVQANESSLRGTWPVGRPPADDAEREAIDIWTRACESRNADYLCTRPRNHNGDHVGAGNASIFTRWEAK